MTHTNAAIHAGARRAHQRTDQDYNSPHMISPTATRAYDERETQSCQNKIEGKGPQAL
ncbi:hypothetical protein ABENE_19950 [Asticcacaulis benevestitus DSM 16100 = ATCC BAA-896]|uniref:Uncharacterized protein n=1 Tax=Asticcacaulis benevestitus DSM 16100 = ATCC BAA-896 TaxID=1121022 RepID=V4NQ98_9CAUL|nr:hypothetical protein ABENE_19950 [Asticcacaulis benevestitus DSM 16100 = ATCC BAA-896]